MCEDDLPRIEGLPRRTATDVKKKFAEVMREVREASVVAITLGGKIETILIDATVYKKVTNPYAAEANDPHPQASLAELTAEFDRRLAVLQSPEARDRVDAMMDAGGKTKRRPTAGDF
jgi:hypothetical protein